MGHQNAYQLGFPLVSAYRSRARDWKGGVHFYRGEMSERTGVLVIRLCQGVNLSHMGARCPAVHAPPGANGPSEGQPLPKIPCGKAPLLSATAAKAPASSVRRATPAAPRWS